MATLAIERIELVRSHFTLAEFQTLAMPERHTWAFCKYCEVLQELHNHNEMVFIVTRGPLMGIHGSQVFDNYCYLKLLGPRYGEWLGKWLDPFMDRFNLPWPELRSDVILLAEWDIPEVPMLASDARVLWEDFKTESRSCSTRPQRG